MSVDDLSCRELVEIVTDYLEGRMPPEERRRFEDHLLACEGCRTYVEQMRQTVRLAGTLSEEQIPSAARDELLVAFREWKRGRP